MPNSSRIPVRSCDNRRCYRAGSIPGCGLALAVIVALLGYATVSHSSSPAPAVIASTCTTASSAC